MDDNLIDSTEHRQSKHWFHPHPHPQRKQGSGLVKTATFEPYLHLFIPEQQMTKETRPTTDRKDDHTMEARLIEFILSRRHDSLSYAPQREIKIDQSLRCVANQIRIQPFL